MHYDFPRPVPANLKDLKRDLLGGKPGVPLEVFPEGLGERMFGRDAAAKSKVILQAQHDYRSVRPGMQEELTPIEAPPSKRYILAILATTPRISPFLAATAMTAAA